VPLSQSLVLIKDHEGKADQESAMSLAQHAKLHLEQLENSSLWTG